MRKSQYSIPEVSGFDPGSFREWVHARHPSNTVKSVAHEIGASPRTVESWLSEGSMPSASWLVKLIAIYGPAFLAAIMRTPPAWLDAARRAQERAALAQQFEQLEARARELDETIPF